VAELIVADGIALLKFSRFERSTLGRHYLAFDLNRVLSVSIEPAPSKAVLGKKTSFKRFSLSKTGDYTNEGKRSFFVGPRRKSCVRVLLVTTQIDVLYLTFGNQTKVCSQLKKRYGPAVSSNKLNLA